MNERTKVFARTLKALQAELRRPQFRQMAVERAFIEWYVRARYGDGASLEITDGPGDGGIDAIVNEGPTRVVLQSKYEPSIRLRTIGGRELAAFEGLAVRFLDPTAGEEFEKWLTRVRKPLHPRYRALKRLCQDSPGRVRFDFVTPKRLVAMPDSRLNVIDVERVAPLWSLYEEGFTPPVDSIEIDFEDIWSSGAKSDAYRVYVGIADVRVFLKLMDEDENERLFAKNVRTDLRTRINRSIRETYERDARSFWLGNNGIYVVASRVTQQARTVRLVYPSIINGSQTLHALHTSRKRHACRVLVRILEMDLTGERDLLTAIIRRTNTQNPMRPMNLAAHEPEQLSIARYLDRLEFFYERRQNEWKNERKTLLPGYVSVSLKEVAQWVAVTTGEAGVGTARSKVGSLFAESSYGALFGRFRDERNGKAFRELAVAVWSGLLVRRVLRRLPKAQRRRAAIVQLLLVRAVYIAMHDGAGALTADVEQLLKHRRFTSPPRDVVRLLASMIREVVRVQGASAKHDASLDLANFFKRDDLTEKAFSRVAAPARLRALRRALVRGFRL
jgi:hypothetical protein